MRNMIPYLHFKGNAAEAMNFYKAVFGGEFLTVQRYRDVAGGEKMAPADQERVIHACLQIAPGISVMATDIMREAEDDLHEGNNYHICLDTESEAETNKLFERLSKDGRVEMPLNKTYWGAYFGMCRDKFGVHWMLNYSPDQKNAAG